ncbi:MAG: two-component regulator propeller domain-containing protein [Dehalococcoidales bacterium]|nr:two-component regulator propeller domain-containing protein [Dehalococcoidales bacterium]
MTEIIVRFILCALIVSFFTAQLPVDVIKADPIPSEKDIVFSKLSSSTLISDNAVFSVSKDKYGYMWFGTRGGLYKSNGVESIKIEGISDDTIRSIYMDSQDILWIGTKYGLNSLNIKTGAVTTYTHDSENPYSIGSNIIWVVFEDRQNNLWFGTTEGLNTLDRETGVFTSYTHNPIDPNSIGNDIVRSIYEDNNGILWIGTNGGLNKLDRETGVFTSYTHNPDDPDSISNNVVWSISGDEHGMLWIGTEYGLNSFNNEKEIFTRYIHNSDDYKSISNNFIRVVYVDSKGKLWIGTDDGLNAFDNETGFFTAYTHDLKNPTSIGSNNTRSVYEDEWGIIWFGTMSGIYYIDPDKQYFKYHDNELVNNTGIRAVDILGDICVLGTSTNIMWFNYKDNIVERYLNYDSISNIRNAITDTVYIDQTGTLWVGTDYIGLLRINLDTGEFTNYSYEEGNSNSITDGWIFSLFYSIEQDLLWIGTDKGLCSFNYNDNIFIQYHHDPHNSTSINSDNINVVYVSEDGRIWIGTDKGLDRFDETTGEFIHYFTDSKQDVFLSLQVESIYEDSNKTLWLGTNNGLIAFMPETGSHELFTKEDGLSDDNIIGITSDNEDNIWFITDYSLSKLSPETKHVNNYGIDHGLRGNIYYPNSISNSEEGLIFVGTTNGLISFDPKQIISSPIIPPVVINGFSLINGNQISFEQPLEEIKEVTLKYSDNSFVIDFVALDYTTQRDDKYAYMLEGFDSNWQYCGSNDNFAKYTNINRGDYIFKVIASNKDNIWNQEGASLKITVLPPFWQEWWFILILTIFAILTVATIIFLRTRSLQMQAQILEVQIVERTGQLVNKSNQLEKTSRKLEESNLALEKQLRQQTDYFNALMHDFKTPLTSIVAASDICSQIQNDKMGRELHTQIQNNALLLKQRIGEHFDIYKGRLNILDIKKEIISIYDLIQSVIDSTKPTASSKQIQVELVAEPGLPLVFVDEQKIIRVMYNLLDNAYKYSSSNHTIVIKIRKHGDYIIIEVQDNGCGMSDDTLNSLFEPYQPYSNTNRHYESIGLGLAICKTYVKLHGGDIWVESKLDEGTTVGFSIPI